MQYKVFNCGPSDYIITDTTKFNLFMDEIERLQSVNMLWKTHEVYAKLFDTFPIKSRTAKAGGTVSIFDGLKWTKTEVTENNLKAVKHHCFWGFVTHQYWKV